MTKCRVFGCLIHYSYFTHVVVVNNGWSRNTWKHTDACRWQIHHTRRHTITICTEKINRKQKSYITIVVSVCPVIVSVCHVVISVCPVDVSVCPVVVSVCPVVVSVCPVVVSVCPVVVSVCMIFVYGLFYNNSMHKNKNIYEAISVRTKQQLA
jgi:hypothetical protein